MPKAKPTAQQPGGTDTAALIKALGEHTDSASLAKDLLLDLDGLFGAIMKLAQRDTEVWRLAKIGEYMAGYWADHYDGVFEQTSEAHKSLRDEVHHG